MWLISTALPEAKIIHVKRNPHSTCWANFKSYFVSNEIGYCYDLSDIVKYFKLYQNLMNFWKDHINTHNFYELDYELLTNNQETEIKKLSEKYNLPLIPFLLKDVALKPDLNLNDGIHPNKKGTIIISNTIKNKILENI